MEIPVTNQHIHPRFSDTKFPSNDIGLYELIHDLNTFGQCDF